MRWPGLRDGRIDKELADGMLLGHYLPPGLLGLAVSGILASIMSTVSKARLAASFGGPVLFLFNQLVVFRYFVDAGPASAYLVVFTSMTATTVLWITVARFTEPESEERFLEFYRRARPLGAWGPIARKAGFAPAGWRPILDGLGVALTGAVMAGAAIVALSCAYVARWDIAATALLASVAAGIAFKKWFRPFVNRLEADGRDRKENVRKEKH